MRIHQLALCAIVACGALVSSASASDWIFKSGMYTRDPQTGKRVEQYQKPKAARTVPYTQYFTSEGPAPYIPYWYYQQEGGYNGFATGYNDAPFLQAPYLNPGGFSGPVGF